MTFELIKERDAHGELSYHVKVNGEFQNGSVAFNMQEALAKYENIKSNYTKAKSETLIKEEL